MEDTRTVSRSTRSRKPSEANGDKAVRRWRKSTGREGADKEREVGKSERRGKATLQEARFLGPAKGKEKAVRRIHGGYYYTVEALTLAETANALGEQVSTVQGMISRDVLPVPILEDESGERHFSRGEVEAMLSVMRAERDYKRRSNHDEVVRHVMHQRIHAYRSQYV